MLRAWSSLPVLSFFGKASVAHRFGMGAAHSAGSCESQEFLKTPITCKMETLLVEVMAKTIANRVHRIWVIDDQGLLVGVVSLSDILKVARHHGSQRET